jgi:hypothetical protein
MRMTNVNKQSSEVLSGMLAEAVATIVRERHVANYESIRALWRTGDCVLHLRRLAPRGKWRSLLTRCARQAGVHPASLDDAARAATAYRASERDRLLAIFELSNVSLTRSHVVLLSRLTPWRRPHAIERMLQSPCSVGELRSACTWP